ncbi:MAG: hypothetical protein ACYTGF_12535 [Planctomycetota bacterium]|jgi:hypothetical protein
MSNTTPRRRKNAVISIAVVLVLVPLAYSVVSPLWARDAKAVTGFLERPDPQHESCVQDTAYMRFHHWELLRETRKAVVRYGIRGEVGLKGCGDCHTSRQRFCDVCHDQVSMTPDCWGCHYYP